MYNKIVLEHFQQPKNQTQMKNPDAKGMGASPVCGDVMTIFLKVGGDKISDASYTTMGCGAAIASGSLLTEILKGKTLDQAKALTAQTLVKELGGLPAIKMHCPDLAIEALRSALLAYDKNHRKAAAEK